MIGSRVAFVALALVALAVGWRAASFGLAGYLAGDDARLALTFDADHPDALTRLAGERLTAGDAAEAEALARRAIEARPLNAAAFRMLGFAAADSGRGDRAATMMTTAAGLSRRDLPANAWMLDRALDEREYAAAFRHADALLRRTPEYADRVFPPMIAALDDPAAVKALDERLRLAPVWRGPFLAQLAGQGSEGAIRAVLAQVQAGRRPLSDRETAWVMSRYLTWHDRKAARAFWTELLPAADRARVSHVYDGGFETTAGEQPFGWQAADEASASTTFAPTDGASGKALHVEHFGPKQARLLSQTLVLEPGQWRLSGRARADEGGRPEALSWTISCGRARGLASTPAPEAGDWRPFEATFTVPDGCPSQTLALEVRPQGGGAASAWFDDLKVEPGAAP